mmetsp:Transcript_34563/g.99267  ORF Transcript_34563/g.99267 Transcript_34563/m.99267 type:complete len:98 (+) Transcript_34563:112-405(+)
MIAWHVHPSDFKAAQNRAHSGLSPNTASLPGFASGTIFEPPRIRPFDFAAGGLQRSAECCGVPAGAAEELEDGWLSSVLQAPTTLSGPPPTAGEARL